MKNLMMLVVLVLAGCVESGVTAPIDPSRCHTEYKPRMGGAFQEVTVCEPKEK